MAPKARIPVYLFSGFLGSGKTTLIQHLLEQYTDTRFYLIENEIGEVSIDGITLRQQVRELVEVSGGCICCTLDYTFRDTMGKLAEQIRTENTDLTQVALLIETTGMADPAQIRAAISTDEYLQSQYELKALVTCLNTVQARDLFQQESQVRQLAARQLTAADIIILTRADYGDESALAYAKELCQYWNPWATLLEAYKGPLSQSLFSVVLKEKPFAFSLRTPDLLVEAPALAQVVILYPDYAFDLMAFVHRMTVLCKVQGEYLYRIKGWIQVGGDARKFHVQSAGKEFWIQPEEGWGNTTPGSCLVFIGMGLQKEPLERVLYGCRDRQSESGE